MAIERMNNNNNLPCNNMVLDNNFDGADSATRLAVIMNKSMQETRQEAREAKHQARELQQEKMKDVAKTLREMADNAWSSALYQGIVSGAAAACQIGGSNLITGSKDIADCTNNIAAGLNVATKVDYWALKNQELGLDKHNAETGASVEGNKASDEGDRESDARRLQESAATQIDKLIEIRHNIAMAALKL